MVPAPSCPLTWDYWTSSTPCDYVELTCLMPNSVFIPLKVGWDATLQDVKEELWEKAVRYPFISMLREMSGYVFRFINSLASAEEVDDETKRLRDIRPVCGVLMILERSVERPGEQLLNTHISHLIGKGLNEFDSLRSSEVNDFRSRMRILAEDNLLRRSQSSLLEKLRYQCPPRLANHPTVPVTLERHLNNNNFILVTKIARTEISFTLNVPVTRTPQQHIEAVRRKANNHNIRMEYPCMLKTEKAIDIAIAWPHMKQKILDVKVCGREEYLLGEHPLIQFLYIQEVLSNDGVPQVMTVNIDNLPIASRDVEYYCLPDRTRLTSEHSNTMRRRHHECSWNIDKDYSILVQTVGGLNVDPGGLGEVICTAGIFHGGRPLCEAQKTHATSMSKDGVATWDEHLQFPIKVSNLPRMARLCFAIYEMKPKTKKKGKDNNKDYSINKLAWANTMIFDYKEQLRTDGVTLFMWTHAADETQGDDLLLHPLGTVVSNPNTDSCSALQLRFSDYECQYPIRFPRQEQVKTYYPEHEESGSPDALARLSRDFTQLRLKAEKDPMYEMHEQERKDIWASREYFRQEAPELLPKLLSCVEWGERAEVASVARMLAGWPALRVESALELLDYAYVDGSVRSFAVRCLANISDEDLLLYLLQLVQALKHESYLMCDLSKFLLERAFNNMTIGHFLFWHLRSEMHVPSVSSVSVRFGLMLEAYCWGCQDHIHSLMRQISCLEKLKWVSTCVNTKKEGIQKARTLLQQHLNEPHCMEALCNFVSPLSPSFVCRRIRTERCRVMDSKKRPLMLDFENADPTGPDICIILKIGDDLRQDMFTLQMLRIMDRLWKNAGYDFRLNPYNCIAMENCTGMIEVVDDAETVANIQKQSALFNAASPMSKTNLFQWLKKNSQDQKALDKAVKEFTMSCAGYSVATYVLGIADRHPDNIMVKRTGQLFHIDFGHFLGKFKHKYGFKRERVPFVLTHDFIHVINKGQRGTGANDMPDFKLFREHCETAFKILREHRHLILSLFSMMISTGLKQLRTEEDLQYLRETLVMDLSEEQAMEHFRQKFIEAMKNSWTTTFNWAIHNFDKNN